MPSNGALQKSFSPLGCDSSEVGGNRTSRLISIVLVVKNRFGLIVRNRRQFDGNEFGGGKNHHALAVVTEHSVEVFEAPALLPIVEQYFEVGS